MIFFVLYVYVMYNLSLNSSETGIKKRKTNSLKSTKIEEA